MNIWNTTLDIIENPNLKIDLALVKKYFGFKTEALIVSTYGMDIHEFLISTWLQNATAPEI
jgi:hypothetical protein